MSEPDGPTSPHPSLEQRKKQAKELLRALRAGDRAALERVRRHLPDKEPMRDGTVETWRMGFIFDVILTRDTWMHRVDIARAAGRPPGARGCRRCGAPPARWRADSRTSSTPPASPS